MGDSVIRIILTTLITTKVHGRDLKFEREYVIEGITYAAQFVRHYLFALWWVPVLVDKLNPSTRTAAPTTTVHRQSTRPPNKRC